MKVLMLSQARSIHDQQSYHDAFDNAIFNDVRVELLNLPFLDLVAKLGWQGFYDEVIRANDEFKPDLIFFQFFHCGGNMESPARCIQHLKSTTNHPMVFASLGDLFQNSPFHFWKRKMPKALVEMAEHTDAFFSTSMGGTAEYLVRHGAKNIVLLPHAYSRLFEVDAGFRNFKYDVAMIGSVYLSVHNPIGSFLHYCHRLQTVRQLYTNFGQRFCLHGKGWKHHACRGPIEFAKQFGVYRESMIVVDARAPYDEMYYCSDRPFYIAGSGSTLILYFTPRLDKLFKDGINAYFVRDPTALISVCNRAIHMPKEVRLANLKATSELIRGRHMVENRVDTILSTYSGIVKCRKGKISPNDARAEIRMWHFLPEVDLNDEYKYCTANWRG